MLQPHGHTLRLQPIIAGTNRIGIANLRPMRKRRRRHMNKSK